MGKGADGGKGADKALNRQLSQVSTCGRNGGGIAQVSVHETPSLLRVEAWVCGTLWRVGTTRVFLLPSLPQISPRGLLKCHILKSIQLSVYQYGFVYTTYLILCLKTCQ
ncbi:unnamed protein product [Ectocarpus sp. 12 AP-2014]